MKIFLPLLLASLLILSAPLGPSGSVVALDIDKNSDYCSAFSIDKDRGYFLTASHCIPEDLDITINEVPAKLAAINSVADLAIIQANVHLPALPLGEAPEQGSNVTMYGRFEEKALPHVLKAKIFGVIAPDGHGTKFVFEGDVAIGGMSGGPIVDEKGAVVSVVIGHFVAPSPLNGKSVGAFYSDVADGYALAVNLK